MIEVIQIKDTSIIVSDLLISVFTRANLSRIPAGSIVAGRQIILSVFTLALPSTVVQMSNLRGSPTEERSLILRSQELNNSQWRQ